VRIKQIPGSDYRNWYSLKVQFIVRTENLKRNKQRHDATNMKNTTTNTNGWVLGEKSIDYNNGCNLLECWSAEPEIGRDSFFGDITQWQLMDGSDVFDVNIAKQNAAAPDEKSAMAFMEDLQRLCKKHGIVFEESF
tara:strand:+ start:157 stop:564 length:408 start_codon:yes stop_codon:yes gene_type:complete